MSGQGPRSSSNSSDESDHNNGDLPHGTRRDDNSISFRHFLQQPSDLVPTGNPRRQHRGNAVLVDLVDVHSGLPDFVQDHLAVEAQLDPEQGQHPIPNQVSPLDLALINEMMPNLLNPSQRQSNNNANPEPSDGLGACGPGPPAVVTALPDFLSDGPMHCDSATGGINDVQRPTTRFCTIPSRNSTGSLGRSQLRNSASNADSLLQQITRLEHELQERDRRIRELENTIFEQKAELVGLYEQIAEQQPEVRNPVAPTHCSGPPAHLANGDDVTTGNVRRLQEIAARAESLLSDLFKEIRHLNPEPDES